MLKKTTKSLLIAMFIVSPVFADDTLSTFNQQGDLDYPEPNREESYFATRALMASQLSTYLGANVGLGLTKLKSEVDIKFAGSSDSGKQNKDIFNYGMGVYGGLGTNLRNFYIGSEMLLAYNSLSKDITSTVLGFSTNLSVKQSFFGGIDIIPGFLTDSRNILLYGRLGVGVGLFKLNFIDNFTKASFTTNKIDLGWRAGLGIEFFLSDSFSLRTEGVYTVYNKIQNNQTDSGRDYFYSVNVPADFRLNLGLTMHF